MVYTEYTLVQQTTANVECLKQALGWRSVIDRGKDDYDPEYKQVSLNTEEISA